ncbi:DUF6223 family protein [Terrimonas alba]|uniref:DUF6223 family protein n=1 Tax=Terrimonas alba TaxID=3349636 RepID=UPI0035F30289
MQIKVASSTGCNEKDNNDQDYKYLKTINMNMYSLLQADLLQVSGITPGRAAALLSAGVGLISVVIGRLALIRSTRGISSGRLMGIVALVLGLVSMVLSVLQLARTTGGFGTGKGRAGAVVALVIGLIGIVLGGLALARFRRNAKRRSAEAVTNAKGKT